MNEDYKKLESYKKLDAQVHIIKARRNIKRLVESAVGLGLLYLIISGLVIYRLQ